MSIAQILWPFASIKSPSFVPPSTSSSSLAPLQRLATRKQRQFTERTNDERKKRGSEVTHSPPIYSGSILSGAIIFGGVLEPRCLSGTKQAHAVLTSRSHTHVHSHARKHAYTHTHTRQQTPASTRFFRVLLLNASNLIRVFRAVVAAAAKVGTILIYDSFGSDFWKASWFWSPNWFILVHW